MATWSGLRDETPPPGATEFDRQARVAFRALCDGDDSIRFDWGDGARIGHFDPATEQSTFRPVPYLCGSINGVELLSVEGRRSDPVMFGALVHQAAHHRHTQWTDLPPNIPDSVLRVARVLEELRAEYQHVAHRPQDAKYLRSAAIVSTPPLTSGALWQVASYAALTLGRIDAGVHLTQPLNPLRTALTNAVGANVLNALYGMWRDALLLPDDSPTRLLRIAQRWVEYVAQPTLIEEVGTCMDEPGAHPALPDDEFEDPIRPDAPPALALAAEQWSRQDPKAASNEDTQSTQDDAEQEQAERRAQQNTADARKKERAKKRAEKALEKLPSNDAGDPETEPDLDLGLDDLEDESGDSDYNDDSDTEDGPPNPSQQQEKTEEDTRVLRRFARDFRFRNPEPDEQSLARKVGIALRKAQFRERTITRTRAEIPPGRLIGREVVLGEAQHATGQTVTAKPFRTTHRRHALQPPLRVGIMVDTSGSMAGLQPIMGTLMWVLAHASTYCDAKLCAVTFGGVPQLVIRPGKPPRRVRECVARGGNEQFEEGFDVIDGTLDLVDSPGARLLFVVSDGNYVPKQRKAAAEATARARRKGVIVLWLRNGPDDDIPPGATPVTIDPIEQLPAVIAAALTDLLRRS